MHRIRQHRHWLARSLFGVLLLGWLSAFAGVCQAMGAQDVDAGHAMHHAGPAHSGDHGCCEDAADPCLHAGCVLKPAMAADEPQLLAAANLLTLAPQQAEAVANPAPPLLRVAVDASPPSPSHPPLHLQYCVFLD